MRIQGPNSQAIANAATDAASKSNAERAERKEQAASSKAVVVNIGEAAGGASRASARLSEEVAARLEEVRSQLQAGTYGIDFERLAERIASDELARAGVER